MDAITICAANYLPFASVLGKSFLANNPDSTFSILVIDSMKVNFEKYPDFKYLTPEDLSIPKNVFANMAFYYNVTELATALKPSALKTLFKNGSKKVIYLDPDIQVFSKLTELDEALDSHNIVLTPHTLNPIPRDGLRPSEADIMGSGTFNLGFIGLSKSNVSENMLDWWEERLRFDSISDPGEMLFTDQRWIDLVPSYFPNHVLREPSYNVAYWNLHERNLSTNGKETFVDGKILRFFHFSGYRPERPWVLSKYVSDNPRIVISNNVILRELCSAYGNAAIENGWSSEFAISYGYQNFESGKRIPSSLRRLYREDCIKSHKNGEVLEPPVDWQSWSITRTVETGNLSRILFSLWKSRPDLKRRYPDATGSEAKELQLWAKTHGVTENVIDPELISIGDLDRDNFPTEFSFTKGVNISGYLQGELGLGQSARLIYESALKAEIPVTPLNSNRSTARQSEKIAPANTNKIYPLIISIVNADHFEFWIDDIGQDRLRYSKIIGVWAWETEDFPKHMQSAFAYVDEIWAVSHFVKDAIAKHTKKPIFVFPTPILTPGEIENLDRNFIGLPKNSNYNLFIFDYSSVFNRKNPDGLVKAHIEAFPNQDGPILVLKSTNGDKDAENREKLRFLVQDRSDILLIEDYLSRNQLTALINECSVYISMHRSEGYGLTLAEAMALGKPVVATNYSGNLDFMNESNSILIPYQKVKIGENSFPYLSDSYWAEPDISIAANEIKKLFSDEKLRNELGRKAKNSVQNFFDFEKSINFITDRVNANYSIFWLSRKYLMSQMSNLIPSNLGIFIIRVVRKLVKYISRILQISTSK